MNFNLGYIWINFAFIIMQEKIGMVQTLVGENHPQSPIQGVLVYGNSRANST